MRHSQLNAKLSTIQVRLLCLLMATLPVFAVAAATDEPNISEAQTRVTTEDQRTFTIRGSGFGSQGPNVAIFEDFESGSAGDTITVDSPVIGSWTDHNGARLDNRARSGNNSLRTREEEGTRRVRLILPEIQRNLFISYWIRIPEGTRFPGNTSREKDFSKDSSWKAVWVFDGQGGYRADNGFDIVLPSHINYGNFSLGGNSYRPENRQIGNDWWSWDEWIRVSVHIRDPLLSGPEDSIVFEAVSKDKGFHRRTITANDSMIPFSLHQFDRMNIPGWMRGGDEGTISPLIDDIYIALGEGAASRVELGNAPLYSDSTQIEILLTDAWSSSSISASLPPAVKIGDIDKWFVYVTRADGSRNEVGFPLCEQCPKPPSFLGRN